MAYTNVFGGLSDALYGAGKAVIRQKYGKELPDEETANTNVTKLSSKVNRLDKSVNEINAKVDKIIAMLSPITDKVDATVKQEPQQLDLFPEVFPEDKPTQLELPLEQAKESLTEQMELPLTTELEESKPDIVEKVMSIAEKSGKQIQLDFTTPLEKAEANIVDTIKQSNKELSEEVVDGVSEFIDKQEQEKLEAEERKSDIQQYSDVEGKTKLSKGKGGDVDLSELMESQKKSFAEIFKMLDSKDDPAGLGSIGKIVGKLAGLVGLAGAVLAGGVALGTYLIGDWLREKLGIDEKFKEVVEGITSFISDPWDFIFGGDSEEEQQAAEDKEAQLKEAGALTELSEEDKEKYLDEAKESGLYDKDMLGDSEVDESKLEQASVEQLQAILQDDDIDARTKGKVLDAIAAKKGVTIGPSAETGAAGATGGETAASGSTGGGATGGSSGPRSRGGARRGGKTYARLEDIPTPELARVKSKSGASAMVNKAYVGPFQSLVNYLDNSGYKIKTLGGYNKRFIRGKPGIPSIHSYGAALDVNPGENPMKENLVTDLPKGIGQVAKKLGLGWGGDWNSIKDPMHFSVDKGEGGATDVRGGVPSMAVPAGEPIPTDPDTASAGTSERPAAEIKQSAGQQPTPAAPSPGVSVAAAAAAPPASTAGSSSSSGGGDSPAERIARRSGTTPAAAAPPTPTTSAEPVPTTSAEPVPTSVSTGSQMIAGTTEVETAKAAAAAAPTIVNNVAGGGCKWQPTPPPPPRPLPPYDPNSGTDQSIKYSFNRDRWALG